LPPDALPEIPQPEPRRGHDHFRVGVFNPQKYTWTASHAEDAPTTILEYDDVAWRGRFSPNAIAEALRWVKAFNSPRFADRETADEWAVLAWTDGGYETIKIDFARSITPFVYCTHEMLTPPHWRPTSLFDMPGDVLTDELSSVLKHKHATLDAAVCAAAEANRKFRPGMRKKSGFPQRWTLVLAVEADALHSLDVLNFTGRVGNLTVTENRRFHVVDATWPIGPAALAIVKGGGHNA
jgi:hypothetical protein